MTSAASAADIPLDRVARPLTVVLSSAVGVEDLSRLGPLLADPATHVVLVLRSLLQDQLDTAQWVLADVVLRLEDLLGAELDEVLTPHRRGTVAVSPEALRQVVRLASAAPESESRRPKLTERETETLWGVAQGMSNRQIARAMGISEHGAKRHLANVMGKLNCQNRTSAVAVALRSGLLELSDVGRDVS
ncbi:MULTISPECIES: LuxR C-terminal-related transcriptional regulator [unclassified Streptomyces]|uniref:helix-turn-helix transcriptional regulator n=1 Tax=unclassified Streptomyces TaxID=2593676 RepID=UPI00202E764F|nr:MULTISPECIES: LuxR C-terminal-related transcriptional regulator [unclassified Streptomyces]MCM1969372.1 LuxR C-terminal-related transcriptional regulator [Streptomyces sp. G1]MCX5127237.1 LuxR C-terminal-related transcriptional regulator [Streptomyces sp. NBC_00347]MCX5295330.1 LuxR C-terminal-related transcriptional regulator [Streptomyces sp. NBC_00193]